MKNKYRVKQFCAVCLIVSLVLQAFVLPGVVGVFARKTDLSDSAGGAATERAMEDTAGGGAGDISDDTTGNTADDTTGDVAEDPADDTAKDAADDIAGDTSGDTAGGPADDTSGDAADNTTGDSTDDTAGDSTDETAGDSTDEIAGDNTDETAGDNTDETAGDNTDESAGDNTDETAGDNTDETAGDNTDETAGDSTDETAGDSTDETAGDSTDETAGDATDETVGTETDETTGAVPDETTAVGAGGSGGAGGAAGGTAGVSTDPTAKPDVTPTEADSVYPWEEMTDEELAEWLMDEANAEEIKNILYDNTSEEYLSLSDRLEIIFASEDIELTKKVNDRMSALLGEIQNAEIATLSDATPDKYIYFDLAAGDVTIGKTAYSGWVYVEGKATPVTGSHTAGNKYYVYQSNTTDASSVGYYMKTGYAFQEEFNSKPQRVNCRVPAYERVKKGDTLWTEYVTNNTDVKAVSIAWSDAAGKSGRTGTEHRITFQSESDYEANVTIDNIWSIYHKGKNERTSGGIGANLSNAGIHCTNTEITLRLKGDNRVGCVHYSAAEGAGNKIYFLDGEDPLAGETNEESASGKADEKFVLLDDITDEEDVSMSAEADIEDVFSDTEDISLEESATDWDSGSITVADFPTDFGKNYWSSAIGAADSPANTADPADGIVIQSGVIYAGTTSADDCTAIGGGGNNFGGVTITGGTVTAVAASTGTAIGGGIGWGSRGGDANVMISGGTVYAYNHGIGTDSGGYTSFVPAVAIGGGSADTNTGNIKTTVTISGGMVYAQSMGGAAIGGGGSGTSTGGAATVNIFGGTVIAKSVGGEVTYYDKNEKKNHTEIISQGVSIGGGTGKTGGGSVELNVKSGILRTGSIGGGMTTTEGKPVGSANVTIEGGDIIGQVIMAGGGNKKCTFTMTGGKIHSTDLINGNTITDIEDPQSDVKIRYIKNNGGAVFMNDSEGVANISGGTIENCKAWNGGAVYMTGGTFTLSGTGKLIGNTAEYDGSKDSLQNADLDALATGLGGAVYVAGGIVNIQGGTIGEKDNPNTAVNGAGVYVTGDKQTKTSGEVNVSNGFISHNSAQIRGGGIYVTGGDVNVSSGTISNNKAGPEDTELTGVGRGGGVYLTGGQFTMEGGTIEGNEAKYRGGGIFLTQSPTLVAGIITGNHANDSGGGVCINGDALTLGNPSLQIYGNTATNNGGGVAVLNGSFILSGGAVGVENGPPNKATKGGGVYVKKEESSNAGTGGAASVTVNSGNIWYNEATEGGGVYLAQGDGTFTMAGVDAFISHNKADNGGGIYLYRNPNLEQGTIASNTATENGGGMCIQDCLVILKPSGTVSITDNHAEKNGAGIYIHDSGNTGTGGSGESGSADSVDAVSSATEIPSDAVGLLVEETSTGHLNFTNNKATGNGGAVCVDTGRFYLFSKNITITGNGAANGGGVAVLQGNFTMYEGSIGQKGGANTATNGGGGVYVSGGDVWLKGGNVNYNSATNGGGVCVENGKIYMYGGEVDENKASNDGGGLYVSTDDLNPLVDILSGSVSSNIAGNNGGGVAVVSTGTGNIQVNVGVNVEHPELNLDTGKFQPFQCTDDCGDAHEDGDHKDHFHSSCPVVESNTAGQKGGGFFLDSPQSHITIYCLLEQGNVAENDPDSHCMDVKGGILKIGDEDCDIINDRIPSVIKGNITMHRAVMVEGGQVDIYGKMENPKFIEDVKVNVKEKTDHYLDHRIVEGDHINYKVHYYENFKGDGDTPTGLYIARQYPDEEHVNNSDDTKYEFTIMSSIFSHPGYKIVGWNTKPDDTGDPYEVNATYNLHTLYADGKLGADITANGETKHDENLLVIYAIWERKGYVLKFDPNVSEGETYTGTMENQMVTMTLLDGSQTIKENQFRRTGYKFLGWTLTPSPADNDKVYEDQWPIKEDFTEEDGAVITLYAKWAPCTHVGSLTYTAEDNVMTESCTVCGGHTATATISAVNCDYDEKTHLATVTWSKNWIGKKPSISYEMASNSNWDHKDDIYEKWNSDTNPQPLHAGEYTAKITAKNAEGSEVIAKTEYTINRIKWETPDVPVISFTVEKNAGGTSYNSIIEISAPIGDNVMYKITHLPKEGGETSVDEYPDWRTENKFINIPFGKYYYFYAKKYEDRDHLESDHSKSTAYLTTGGNIVYIKHETGIKVEPQYGDGQFKYTVSAAEGYHLRKYSDNLPEETMSIGPDNIREIGFVKPIPGVTENDAYIQDDGIQIARSELANKTYEYIIKFGDHKVAYHQITLEFSGAAKDATVAYKVTDGQVFGDFNSKTTSISCDSAFTVQFNVSDYIPVEYEIPKLSFSQVLPQGTTVIMKSGVDYWYYNFTGEKDYITLTDFISMGENGKWTVPNDVVPNATYQFIVDFSQVSGTKWISNDVSLGVSLVLTPKSDSSAPKIPANNNPHISLDMKTKAVFKLESNGVNGKSATFNCTYAPSTGAASIWNGRKTALVLTMDNANTAEIPADLTLTAVVDRSTTRYKMNADKQFIIPLGNIGPEKVDVKVTLNSDLFGLSEEKLTFNAKWYVSQSAADKSPLNGYEAASCDQVTFSCAKDPVPSVRIEGEKRLCQVGGILTVNVHYKDIPDGGTITAYLQSKEGVDTGANVDIIPKDGDEKHKLVTFNMGQMEKGTYRISVIVKKESEGNILQVPYYFIIE